MRFRGISTQNKEIFFEVNSQSAIFEKKKLLVVPKAPKIKKKTKLGLLILKRQRSQKMEAVTHVSPENSPYLPDNTGRAFVKLMNTADEIMEIIASKVFAYKLLYTDLYLSNFTKFSIKFARINNLTTSSLRAFKLEKREQEFFFSVLPNLQERIKAKFGEIQPEIVQLLIYWEPYWWNRFVEDIAVEPICQLIHHLDTEFPGTAEKLTELDYGKENKEDHLLNEFSFLNLNVKEVNGKTYVPRKLTPLDKLTGIQCDFQQFTLPPFQEIPSLLPPGEMTEMEKNQIRLMHTCNEIMQSIAGKVFKQKLAQSLLYLFDLPQFSKNFASDNKVTEPNLAIFKLEKTIQSFILALIPTIQEHIKATLMRVLPEIVELSTYWELSWFDQFIENSSIKPLYRLYTIQQRKFGSESL